MATALLGLNLGQSQYNVVVTNPGPATTSNDLEINIDLTKITSKEGALLLIQSIEDAMISNTWPPA